MLQKDCIVIIKESTKKKLSDFKKLHESEILKEFSKDRRFVSWDNTIGFMLKILEKEGYKIK